MAEPDREQLRSTTLQNHYDRPFIVCRGDRITHISELANCIGHITEDQFRHHVTADKDDFAQWIEDVLLNPWLAKDLRHERNKQDRTHYVKTIRDHVAWLEG